ncbi:MAG: hypothetical protein R2865_05625 [Deinococcales bacterium]
MAKNIRVYWAVTKLKPDALARLAPLKGHHLVIPSARGDDQADLLHIQAWLV